MNIEYWTEWHANNNFLEIGICYMLYNVVYNKKKSKEKIHEYIILIIDISIILIYKIRTRIIVIILSNTST